MPDLLPCKLSCAGIGSELGGKRIVESCVARMQIRGEIPLDI